MKEQLEENAVLDMREPTCPEPHVSLMLNSLRPHVTLTITSPEPQVTFMLTSPAPNAWQAHFAALVEAHATPGLPPPKGTPTAN